MACELWHMACEVWSLACELWPMACEVWSMVREVWPMACELWPVTCELWSIACGVWSMACEVWSRYAHLPKVLQVVNAVAPRAPDGVKHPIPYFGVSSYSSLRNSIFSFRVRQRARAWAADVIIHPNNIIPYVRPIGKHALRIYPTCDQ
jgi:hypothetical protein